MVFRGAPHALGFRLTYMTDQVLNRGAIDPNLPARSKPLAFALKFDARAGSTYRRRLSGTLLAVDSMQPMYQSPQKSAESSSLLLAMMVPGIAETLRRSLPPKGSRWSRVSDSNR